MSLFRGCEQVESVLWIAAELGAEGFERAPVAERAWLGPKINLGTCIANGIPYRLGLVRNTARLLVGGGGNDCYGVG